MELEARFGEGRRRSEDLYRGDIDRLIALLIVGCIEWFPRRFRSASRRASPVFSAEWILIFLAPLSLDWTWISSSSSVIPFAVLKFSSFVFEGIETTQR